MNIKIALALFTSTALLAGLACDTGQILEPEQATQAVMGTRAAAADAASGPATDAQYVEGDEVEFTGVSFLIGLAANAGDTDMVAHVERGATGTVLESTAYDGAAWYRVQTDAGTGWVKANALQRIPTAVEGLEVGSQARIAGTGFLIMLRDAAGSIRQIAGQERGTIVTIVRIQDVGGETWYFVDAPTGEGWLPAENLEPIEAEAAPEGTGTPEATATDGA